MEQKSPIILFDGVCNLCHSTVNWLIRIDHRRKLRFASLQSKFAQSILFDLGGGSTSTKSVVLIDERGVHFCSDAVLLTLKHLGLPYALGTVAMLFPRFLRDGIYNWIAQNRYRWFGVQSQCPAPLPELRSRFLDSSETRIED
ncbi:MAG: hypothetical protein RLZZ488_783 [Pseudomonadota bacterium]|jgi:predicted DCC family thiol-disulfide oxidoreductase YuxK